MTKLGFGTRTTGMALPAPDLPSACSVNLVRSFFGRWAADPRYHRSEPSVTNRRRVSQSRLFALLFLPFALACSQSGGTARRNDAGCQTGAETCPCYGNGTCNQGLTCASNLCVNLGNPSGGGGASGQAGAGGSAAAGGGVGGIIGSGGAAGSGGSGAATGIGGQTATGGAGAQTGSGGVAGAAGQIGQGGSTGAGGGACQTQSVSFTARTPTVLILVDRGGTEFSTATTGTFFNVKTAVEGAIANVQAQYRLGLGVYVGDHSSGSCQLNYDAVPIALNNAFAIGAGYDALGPLQPYPTAKADTPTTEAIPMAQAALAADPGTGGKILLLITSAHTDFCDDAPSECGEDAATFQIQQMYAATPSIETLVVGLPVDPDDPSGSQALLNFANAGAGQPVIPASTSNSMSVIYYDCDATATSQDGGPDSWPNLLAASGHTGTTPVATYASAGGTAPLYKAASSSATDVETALNAALAAAKSCAFDLTPAQLSIDPGKLGEGTVTVAGNKVPQDASNGWSMPTPIEVVLSGSACTIWRQPNATISFSFPCDAIRN
jgi:hypothetical protein